MAQAVSVQFYKGEDVVLSFAPASGTPSIAGWTFLLTVKAQDADSAALLSVPGAIVSASAGTFSVTLTSAQTQALGTGIFYFDVWRTDVPSSTALAIGRMSVLANPRFGA